MTKKKKKVIFRLSVSTNEMVKYKQKNIPIRDRRYPTGYLHYFNLTERLIFMKNVIRKIFVCNLAVGLLILNIGKKSYAEQAKNIDFRKKILGTWKIEEKIDTVLAQTSLTFKEDNHFIYMLEESIEDKKANSTSEGTYSIDGSILKLKYESFNNIPLDAKDKQNESIDIYIINDLLGFPAYEEIKNSTDNKDRIYSTHFSSNSANSKYGFETDENSKETITLKMDSTFSILTVTLKKQKTMGKIKDEEVKIEKTGVYKENKESIILNIFNSSVDKKTSKQNPEIKNIKIVKEDKFVLINPFKKIK